MEDQWLTYAKRLQAIASTGLHFCRDEYDRERFGEVGEIANARFPSWRDQTDVVRLNAYVTSEEKRDGAGRK